MENNASIKIYSLPSRQFLTCVSTVHFCLLSKEFKNKVYEQKVLNYTESSLAAAQ